MTGEIPSGIIPGEDGRGRKIASPSGVAKKDGSNQSVKDQALLSGNTSKQDELRSLSEGMQYAPKELIEQQSMWMRREQEEKRRALLQEKERLEKLAQEEEKL